MRNIVTATLLTSVVIAGMMLSNDSATADDLIAIKDKGYARVVVANEQPYGFIDAENEGAGIGPDVATAVLRKIGVTNIQWSSVTFAGLIPGVKADRFDFAAAEQAILPERCAQVQFTQPNSSYTSGLMVLKGNPKTLHSFEDLLKAPGVKLAVVSGADEIIPDAYQVPRENRVYIQTRADAIATLTSGRADAYYATELTIADLVKQSSEVQSAEMTGPPTVDGKPYRKYGAFTFRTQDKELFAAFSAALNEFKKTDDYEKILTRYGLSKDSIQAARDGSTEKLCAGE
ncbi:ectoine/hydroxyectoine ABC transporter substrate-binding protein EhuB [Ensifer sp. NBAIM29]|nr:ectoine/hydroxyectoine ABC transporter substrate-binding protein EhuB [Ensifer sp. NBAIM29]